MKKTEEELQKMVLDTISRVCSTNDPVSYARFNGRVYEVAMEALRNLNDEAGQKPESGCRKLRGRILRTEVGDVKCVLRDDGAVEFYQRTGSDDEVDPWEYVGESDALCEGFEFETVGDDELESLYVSVL